MRDGGFDFDRAVARMADSDARKAFATLAIANRVADRLPPPQRDADLAALFAWYIDPTVKPLDRVTPLPDDLALRLSETVLRLAATNPVLASTLEEVVAEQELARPLAVKESLGRAAAVSLILMVAMTGFEVHGTDWAVHHEAVNSADFAAVIAALAALIVPGYRTNGGTQLERGPTE